MCRIAIPTPYKEDTRTIGRLHHYLKKGAGQHKTSSSGDNRHVFLNDHSMMYGFKVIPCSKRCRHDWTECPYAHKGEKEARRDPATYLYTGVLCPDMKQNKPCPRGDDCPFSHTVFELWLHPTRFRTVFCADGCNCTRKFCFFAHSPEELREPELAQLQSPLERGAPEGTPQHVSPDIQGAADAANNDQAPAALIDSLVEILNAEPDEIKKKLEDAQRGSLPAQDAALPQTAGKPVSERLQSGLHMPCECGCGCGCGGSGKLGKRQREPTEAGSYDAPLTQLQLAAYLAGYQYARGLCDGAVQTMPATQPQPQPLYPGGAPAEQGMDACNWGSPPESGKVDVPWVGDIEGFCTPLSSLLGSFDFSSLSPLSDASAPVAFSSPTQPPYSPSNGAWDGAICPGASGVSPVLVAGRPLNAPCIDGANHFHRGPASRQLDSSPSSMDSTSCSALDPRVDFHGAPLSSHAAPFDHLAAKRNSPSGYSPDFSFFSAF